MNPYDCSRPGNLFSGDEDVLRGMREKLVDNQRSFSVQGGRRCGKTSLLKKLGGGITAFSPAFVRWRLIEHASDRPTHMGRSVPGFLSRNCRGNSRRSGRA